MISDAMEIADESLSRKRMIADDSLSEPGNIGGSSPVVYRRNRATSTPDIPSMVDRTSTIPVGRNVSDVLLGQVIGNQCRMEQELRQL